MFGYRINSTIHMHSDWLINSFSGFQQRQREHFNFLGISNRTNTHVFKLSVSPHLGNATRELFGVDNSGLVLQYEFQSKWEIHRRGIRSTVIYGCRLLKRKAAAYEHKHRESTVRKSIQSRPPTSLQSKGAITIGSMDLHLYTVILHLLASYWLNPIT